MSDFNACIEQVLDNEGGGYVPDDYTRGPSRWGITLASYRELHPEATGLDIANLTRETATPFYEQAFWNRYRFGLITNQGLAFKVFDVGVNIGPGTAVRLLQRTAGVDADGLLGPHTAALVNAMDPTEALGAFRIEAERYYRAVATAHPERAGQLAGWLARLAK